VKSEKFNRISSTYRNYQLIHKRGGDYGYNDGVLDIKRDGKTIASIMRNGTNGYSHICYGFYKNYIVSGGSTGQLKIYNLKGKEVANLVGHTGEVWSIAIDGDRLVSGSSDQTIRIWDLNKLKMKIEKRKINEEYILAVMKKYNISRDNVFKQAKKISDNKIYITPIMQPQLSLFISKTNDWIAWTPQGFYNASKGGEKYIGYHINHGAGHEAEFLDISRFRKQFYRPDLIAKAIEGEDISHYAKNIDIDSILRDSGGLPPKVKILTTPFATDRENIEIGVEVCDMGGGFDNLNFYMDGKAIKYLDQSKAFRRQKKQVQNCTILEEKLSIASGKHTIGVDATNKEGNILSNRATVEITNTQKVVTKPNLHLLTLSINDYRDSSLHLKYPNNDAKELTAKVKEIGKPIFKNIYTYALKDSEVTKESISAKIAQIAPKVGVNDVFVLYISGHGITNDKDGDYYFIPYGCPNGADVTQKAISQEQFKKWIAQLQTSKFTILIDTCESGSVAQQSFASSVQRFGTNAGVAIIAGATSKQNAIDGYKKHGIFTYTLLEAMNNNLVYSYDKKLSINEVAGYVKDTLPKLAKKEFGHRQEPTIYMQGDTTFVIGGF